MSVSQPSWRGSKLPVSMDGGCHCLQHQPVCGLEEVGYILVPLSLVVFPAGHSVSTVPPGWLHSVVRTTESLNPGGACRFVHIPTLFSFRNMHPFKDLPPLSFPCELLGRRSYLLCWARAMSPFRGIHSRFNKQTNSCVDEWVR